MLFAGQLPNHAEMPKPYGHLPLCADPTDYVPTIFDTYCVNTCIDDKLIALSLWVSGSSYHFITIARTTLRAA